MEMERIVRSHLLFVCRTTSTQAFINMGGVVVDHDNHTRRLGRFFYLPTRLRLLQEFTQPRNFLHAKIVGARPFEKGTLATDAKHKLIVSVGLDLTKTLDQLDGLAPTQVMG
jgi:hypothetical protein